MNIDELFLQHHYHIHKLTGFSHFKSNQTINIHKIKYEINNVHSQSGNIFNNPNFKEKINYDKLDYDKLDIIFYNSNFKEEKYYDNSNIDFFKKYIGKYLLSNNSLLRILDKNIPELNKENFNNYKITIKMVINKPLGKVDGSKVDNISFKSKYLKYKNKYLLLKNQVGGWNCTCGQPVNNNLVRCPNCGFYDVPQLILRLNAPLSGLSPQFINKVQNIFINGNLNLVINSENSTLTNIIPLPQINLDWIPMYDEPDIRYLEKLIIFIYIKNYIRQFGPLPEEERISDMLHLILTQTGSNFNDLDGYIEPNIIDLCWNEFNIVVQPLVKDQLVTVFRTPLLLVIASKNANTYFNDGTPANYINDFLLAEGKMPHPSQHPDVFNYNTSIQTKITQPISPNKFINDVWRNEILLEHIFNLNQLHNSMGWETINLLLNFAEKLGSNFSNIKIIQFIHSYLHILDKINFDIPANVRNDTHGRLNDLRGCFINLSNLQINQLELALNINCSNYLLKNIAGQFYFPNNRQYYIRSAIALSKNRTYRIQFPNPNPDLLDEPPIIHPSTPTTGTSFCDGKITPA